MGEEDGRMRPNVVGDPCRCSRYGSRIGAQSSASRKDWPSRSPRRRAASGPTAALPVPWPGPWRLRDARLGVRRHRPAVRTACCRRTRSSRSPTRTWWTWNIPRTSPATAARRTLAEAAAVAAVPGAPAVPGPSRRLCRPTCWTRCHWKPRISTKLRHFSAWPGVNTGSRPLSREQTRRCSESAHRFFFLSFLPGPDFFPHANWYRHSPTERAVSSRRTRRTSIGRAAHIFDNDKAVGKTGSRCGLLALRQRYSAIESLESRSR